MVRKEWSSEERLSSQRADLLVCPLLPVSRCFFMFSEPLNLSFPAGFETIFSDRTQRESERVIKIFSLHCLSLIDAHHIPEAPRALTDLLKMPSFLVESTRPDSSSYSAGVTTRLKCSAVQRRSIHPFQAI